MVIIQDPPAYLTPLTHAYHMLSRLLKRSTLLNLNNIHRFKKIYDAKGQEGETAAQCHCADQKY